MLCGLRLAHYVEYGRVVPGSRTEFFCVLLAGRCLRVCEVLLGWVVAVAGAGGVAVYGAGLLGGFVGALVSLAWAGALCRHWPCLADSSGCVYPVLSGSACLYEPGVLVTVACGHHNDRLVLCSCFGARPVVTNSGLVLGVYRLVFQRVRKCLCLLRRFRARGAGVGLLIMFYSAVSSRPVGLLGRSSLCLGCVRRLVLVWGGVWWGLWLGCWGVFCAAVRRVLICGKLGLLGFGFIRGGVGSGCFLGVQGQGILILCCLLCSPPVCSLPCDVLGPLCSVLNTPSCVVWIYVLGCVC